MRFSVLLPLFLSAAVSAAPGKKGWSFTVWTDGHTNCKGENAFEWGDIKELNCTKMDYVKRLSYIESTDMGDYDLTTYLDDDCKGSPVVMVDKRCWGSAQWANQASQEVPDHGFKAFEVCLDNKRVR